MPNAHQLDAARIVGTKAVSTTSIAGSPMRLRHTTSSNIPIENVTAPVPIARIEPLRIRVAHQPRATATTVPTHNAVPNHDTLGDGSVMESSLKTRTINAMTLAVRPGTTAKCLRSLKSRAAWLMDLTTFLFSYEDSSSTTSSK